MFWKHGEQYAGLHRLIYKSEDTIYVGQDDFKSSKGRFILSEGFSRCNGIVFFDLYQQKGALAHISPATDPRMLIVGEVGHVLGGGRRVERLGDCFPQPEDVIVFNVCHSYAAAWCPEVVDTELGRLGFGIKDIRHVLLETIQDNSYVVHRAIALDTKMKEVYIFPNNNTSLIRVPF